MSDRRVMLRAGLTRRLLDRVPDRAVPVLNGIAFAALAVALLVLLLL
ncbi:hypothetical protein [Elioraea sp.]|jgi:hypothetical protein|nr:hypothetical protein [Elioraea sp.]GIX10946.1 MAG: hypothetical protein KatS3mg116_2656 [Elioraea sp.]